MATRITGVYTPEQREEIIAHVLAELSAGVPISRTLGEGREDWLCCERCWWNWYYEDDAEQANGLVQKVARARACGVEAMMDRAVQVAETVEVGEIVTTEPLMVDGKRVDGEDVVKVKREDMLGHRRLKVDTYIKAAQMLKPKTYGPKLDLTSGGERINAATALEAARKRAKSHSDESNKD